MERNSILINTLKYGEKFNFNDNFDDKLTLEYIKNLEKYLDYYENVE